ncbi:Dynein light chain roadblock-type 2-like [Oopsacas minuta]|uniref:Dynein light chain roadblock-type 2-like n=1 Tax=Oopsacas minuta TaxID=111878 RepID=A0AAV7KGK5_9METZ|nr:Dynein light chain roadblock-type 2-like [Oopsacas minuta]
MSSATRANRTITSQTANSNASSHASEIWDRIQLVPGVIGLFLVDSENIIVKSTLDNSTTAQYSTPLKPLIDLAMMTVRELNPINRMQTLRIATMNYEIMIYPEKCYFLIAIQQNKNAKYLKPFESY